MQGGGQGGGEGEGRGTGGARAGAARRGVRAEWEPGGLIGGPGGRPGGGGGGRGGEMEEEAVNCRLRHRYSLCPPDGEELLIWIGDKLVAFPREDAALLAHEQHLQTQPEVRKAPAAREARLRHRRFVAARREDEDDGSAARPAPRGWMERHVAHLLVATWTRVTGRPAFANDFALADIVFCLNTEPEAYIGLQLKTCRAPRGDGNLSFQHVRGYTDLLVVACIRSTLEFLAFSGKELDLRGKKTLKVRTLLHCIPCGKECSDLERN